MSWPSAGSSLLFGFLLELAYLFPQWNLLIFCTKICSLTSLLCCISVFIFSVATYFSFALFTWDSGFFRALCKFHAPLIFNVLPLPCNKLVHVRGCWFPLLLPFDRPALYFSSALVLVYCLFFEFIKFSSALPSVLFLWPPFSPFFNQISTWLEWRQFSWFPVDVDASVVAWKEEHGNGKRKEKEKLN